MNHSDTAKQRILLQAPDSHHAAAVYQLILNSKPLDVNSEYLYLLLCSHYRSTCVIALSGNEVVGVATAYLIPEQKNTLFVWQIAVAEQARRLGLGKTMVKHLLNRPVCADVGFVEATVSPSNAASLNLFKALAQDLETEFRQKPYFEKELFRGGNHEEENLIRVGPLKRGE